MGCDKMKKFNVNLITFKQFLYELGFRYTNNEKTIMYSDEYGDTWICFSTEMEERLSNYHTVLNYSDRNIFNIVDFVKLLNERKDIINSHNESICRMGDSW